MKYCLKPLRMGFDTDLIWSCVPLSPSPIFLLYLQVDPLYKICLCFHLSKSHCACKDVLTEDFLAGHYVEHVANDLHQSVYFWFVYFFFVFNSVELQWEESKSMYLVLTQYFQSIWLYCLMLCNIFKVVILAQNPMGISVC